jgi:uncharacterized membrane protein YkvA (DUF1232 family)
MALVSEIVNHFRLTWRLFWDAGVRSGRRLIFFVPLLYLLLPFRYDLLADLLPLIGLLDDWLLFVVCTYAFAVLCPRDTVRRLRTVISLSDPDPDVREQALANRAAIKDLSAVEQFEMYRHPRECVALTLMLAIAVGVSALGGLLGTALLLLFVAASFLSARVFWAWRVRDAVEATPENYSQVQACVDRCLSRLPDIPVRVVVLTTGGSAVYSFGLEPPYTLALGAHIVEALDADELAAVVGRELGHILFEHTFLSSLLGGMLYRMSVLGHVWRTFLGPWRNLAEQTADRVGLLACGELEPVVRVAVKLMSGDMDREVDAQAVLHSVYARTQERSREDGIPKWLRWSPKDRLQALVDFDAELFALRVEEWLSVE